MCIRDRFDTVEVDFGRSEGNNIEQADGKKWSEQDRDTFDPTHDIDPVSYTHLCRLSSAIVL